MYRMSGLNLEENDNENTITTNFGFCSGENGINDYFEMV